jgi:arginase family enzyme
MPEPGTVLLLDAHGDLRASYEGSQYSHACRVFRLLEQVYQMVDTLEILFSCPQLGLRGVDVVEMVPEPSRVSAMVAAKRLQKIISFWGLARGFKNRPQTGSQLQVEYD